MVNKCVQQRLPDTGSGGMDVAGVSDLDTSNQGINNIDVVLPIAPQIAPESCDRQINYRQRLAYVHVKELKATLGCLNKCFAILPPKLMPFDCRNPNGKHQSDNRAYRLNPSRPTFFQVYKRSYPTRSTREKHSDQQQMSVRKFLWNEPHSEQLPI